MLIRTMQTIIGTAIDQAVRLLKAGEIAALPAETVYGLAGNALDSNAIAKIFAAKNRPQDNPLIVHVSDMEMVSRLELEIPPLAEKLAERFWAGALTIVFKKTKKSLIPTEISCGLDSVAVRVPANEIFLEIIRQCGFPLAAPSANLSGNPSPTTAKHVYDDLNGRIPLIINGGNCEIGIESTVITLENNQIRILRPGAITPEMLSEFAEVVVDDKESSLSPGTRHKHYSPKAEVIAVSAESEQAFTDYIGETKFAVANPDMQTLFAELRRFDEQDADRIYIRLPETSGVGLALYNRIIRAAEFKIIEVGKNK
ncbi:MAG: L-threonylcarbamoyladenylate synthase [Oscillospiraceae bacterium]|nr:L-threonylcarbamoyladenylate synthase [Oscillospiraceae bacterium]